MWIEKGYKLINTHKCSEIYLSEHGNYINFYSNHKQDIADHTIEFSTREEAVKCFNLIADRLLHEESLLILD